ncbi:hypothetical protein [Negativibacillus massiliensis]
MEKMVYETPKMEIVYFETEDVIRTSGVGGTAPDFGWGEWPESR